MDGLADGYRSPAPCLVFVILLELVLEVWKSSDYISTMQRLPLLLALVSFFGFSLIEFLPAQTSSPPVTRSRSQDRAIAPRNDRDNYTIPKLEYPNADVLSILRIYEELTGKKLVYDKTVQGQVNIVISTPVTKEEAIRIIEINLILNGFSLVPAEGDIVKVLGISKNPRSAGVPIYNSDEELPEGDQVVSMLFKLRYAAPDELAQLLSQYIAPQAWTSVVPLVKSQSILITENTSVLSGIRKIIRQVDVPPADVTSEFIALHRADAEDVIEKLRNIFTPEETPGRSRTVPAPNRLAIASATPAAPGQADRGAEGSRGAMIEIAATQPNEDSLIVGKILLTADVRTNRIHVVTRPINMPFVRDLIWQFDSEVSFGQPTARPLRYVSAGDILDMIVQAISEKGMEAEGEVGATGSTASRQPEANQSLNTSLGGTTGSSSGGLNVSEGLSTEPTDTTPLAVTVGNSRIIADRRSNAIIVIANNDVKEKVFQLIDEIDVRAPQVLLNTVIGELSLGENFELGVDYLYRSENSIVPAPQPSTTTNGNGTVVTNPVSTALGSAFAAISRNTTAPLLDAAAVGSAAAFGTPLGGLTAYLAPIDELQIILRALQATNRFRVTSRPTVFTSNNKKAIIVSGQEVAVPVSSVSTFQTTPGVPTVQSSIQFKSIALQLEVVPLINDRGDVSLDILQKVDSISGESMIDGNRIPTISTRYIRTNVLVPDRGVVYLGGLITLNVQEGESGIPYLSRIPLLGRLFRTETKDETRSELIVLLRPEVTRGPQELAVLREKEEEMMYIEPDLDETLYPKGERRVAPGRSMLRPPEMPSR